MRKLDWIKWWIILWIGILLSGCATTGDVRILDGEVYKLQSQLNRIQKEKDSIKNEIEAFQKEAKANISTLQKETNILRTDLTSETQKRQADLALQSENLRSEIRILSTGVEEYKDFLKGPSKEVERVREDIALRTKIREEREKNLEEKYRTQEDRTKALDERTKGVEVYLKGLESHLKGLNGYLKGLDEKIDRVSSKQVELEKSISTTETPVEVKGVSTGMGDLYKDAYGTFQKGDLEGARRKFEAFLKQYPNTELSDNAQFWIGETYYVKRDFEKAILEYEKAIVKYPEGDKIPAALFKQALAFLELGDKTNARNLLKRVIERYPHAEQVDIAKKYLERTK